jgi:hypothetical protein
VGVLETGDEPKLLSGKHYWAALNLLKPEGPNTINVSGSCHEHVSIQGFENLTLNAISGASITDTSGGADDVVDIGDSTDVTLQGFTINGGDVGVFCEDFSVCRLNNNTIQNATASVSGDGVGVWVGRSRATFNGDVVQHNSGPGVIIANASAAQVANVQVNNNGVGAFVGGHSTLALSAGAITGNAGSGVFVRGASVANINSFSGPINISGNSGNGVEIHDLSFAIFVSVTITNNAPFEVKCFQQPYLAQGATTDIGRGTTNCTEPQ